MLGVGQVARLLATERREGGGVFNFDVGSTSTTATATARAFSTATSAGVAATATATARVATAATAATAATVVAVITVIRRLRRSNAEANVNLLLGSGVLRAVTLALHADAAKVQVGVVGVARHELEAFESRAIEYLSFRPLPLSGQGRSLFGLERFGLRERELAGVIHDLRFGFAFIDGVGAELGEFVAGFAPVALTGTATVAIVASTRGVTTIKVASRALAAFAAFAASAATSRAGVTFMIASSALGVEPLAAFGTDNFALEFTSRLRRLSFAATVASRGRSDCVRDKKSKRQSSSALDWGLPSSAHCFSRRVARVRGFARAHRRPARVNARLNSHSPPCDRLRPTPALASRAARAPFVAGLLAGALAAFALGAGARGASSSSAMNGFADIAMASARHRDAPRITPRAPPRADVDQADASASLSRRDQSACEPATGEAVSARG